MPSTATDRIDGLSTSTAIKAPCRVATTGTITLSGLQTIDGVTVVADDRVLVKDQSTQSDNGIYLASSTAWQRAKDFDGARDATLGTIVIVNSGTTNANTYWRLTTTGTVTFGTSSITFASGLASDAAAISYTADNDDAIARSVTDRLQDVLSVMDFGAIGDGTTHPLSERYATLAAAQAVYPHATALTDQIDWAAIQLALNSLTNNQSLYFPSTPGAYFYVNRTLLLPTLNGVTLFGDGKLATRIRLVDGGASTDLFARSDTSALEANNVNHWQIRGIAFDATGTTRHCFNWLSLSRSSIEDCYFDNFGGRALYVTSSLGVKVRNCIFSSNASAIYQDTTGWTGMNGWDISGCYISLSTSYAVYIGTGMVGAHISGCVFESNALGGLYFQQDSHAISIAGCYFEENKSASTTTSDIYIGTAAVVSTVSVRSCYFNGDTVATDFYYPIRMGFARHCVIEDNQLAVGGKFIKFETASNTDNTFGKLYFVVGAFVVSNLSQPTLNFASSSLQGFVNAGNEIIASDLAEFVPTNVIRPRFPYGGWTISTTGTGSAIRSGTDILGAPALFMTRPAASTCSATQTFTIQAHLTGRIVTVALPVTCVADGSVQVDVTPNGTSPITATVTESLVATGRTIIYAAAYVPSGATTIAITITMSTSLASFIVGHPCLYVGARISYNSDGETDFEHTAAPTTGTWVRNDRVWNSAPAALGVPGWVCVTAGSPGTWSAMAALA